MIYIISMHAAVRRLCKGTGNMPGLIYIRIIMKWAG